MKEKQTFGQFLVSNYPNLFSMTEGDVMDELFPERREKMMKLTYDAEKDIWHGEITIGKDVITFWTDEGKEDLRHEMLFSIKYYFEKVLENELKNHS